MISGSESLHPSPKGPFPAAESYESDNWGPNPERPRLVAIGTVIEPVPVTGLAANFSPIPRMAPPPLGRLIAAEGLGVAPPLCCCGSVPWPCLLRSTDYSNGCAPLLTTVPLVEPELSVRRVRSAAQEWMARGHYPHLDHGGRNPGPAIEVPAVNTDPTSVKHRSVKEKSIVRTHRSTSLR